MGRKLPKWLARLNEPAITGLYLAYVDLFTWISKAFSRGSSPSPLAQEVERVSFSVQARTARGGRSPVSDERENGYAAVWNLVSDAPEGTDFALVWRAVHAYADAAEAYRKTDGRGGHPLVG